MRPILVGGTGRSGTTVMAAALGRHSQVAGPPGELRILTDPGGLLDFMHTLVHCWTPYTADDAWWRLVGVCSDHQGVMADQMQLLPQALRKQLAPTISRTSYGQGMQRQLTEERGGMVLLRPLALQDARRITLLLLEQLYRGARPRATHWVDGTPCNMPRALQLRRLLGPSVRWVWMRRDPSQVVGSMVQHIRDGSVATRWWPDTPVGCAWWERHVGDACTYAAARLGADVLPVRLEGLASAPEQQLRAVCTHLGLQYEAGMAEAVDPGRLHRYPQEEG